MKKINCQTQLGNHKYFCHDRNIKFFYTLLLLSFFLFIFPILLLLLILHLCFLLTHVCDVQLQKTWLLLPGLLFPLSSTQRRHRAEDAFCWLLVKLSSDKIHLWGLLVFFWRFCGGLDLGFCRAAFIQYRHRRRGRGRGRPSWWRGGGADRRCAAHSAAAAPHDCSIFFKCVLIVLYF